MRTLSKGLLIGALAVVLAAPVFAQVHKYFTPGSVWTVTMIQITPGMDQMYMQYLDWPVQDVRRGAGQGGVSEIVQDPSNHG